MTSSRDILRSVIRHRRQHLSLESYDAYATEITQHLINHPLFQNSQHIASFLSVEGEVNTAKIHEAAWAEGKSLYLPCLQPSTEDPLGVPVAHAGLHFKRYTPETTLSPNKFRILEPQETPQIEAQALELVLTPLVAFDDHGHRVGMGKGYYDKTFHFLLHAHHPSVKLVGLAYYFQHTTEIIPQQWDVPLHAVVTEAGWFWPKRG